jgi:hypothetical protein
MLSPRRAVVVLTALVVLSTFNACSGDNSSADKPKGATTTGDSTTTGVPVPVGATFHATAHWTGAVTLDGSYDVEYRSSDPQRNSCSALANPPSPGATFAVPLPTTIGTYHVNGVAAASPFDGPGDYAADRFQSVDVTVDPDGDDPPVHFVVGAATTLQLSVTDDGSGMFQFGGLDAGASGSLSGTVEWTCT